MVDCALDGAAVAQVGQRRRRDADDVVAAVIVEPLIFDRGQRPHDMLET
mgnify:CR=1 FL=1